MNIQPFLSIIQSGDWERFRQEMAHFSADVTPVSPEEKAQLVRAAARAGQAEMLRYLFEHHLSAAEPDADGRTVLHEAALSGDADTVRFAMDVLGFDPLEGDLQGITPLDLARVADKPTAYDPLRERTGLDPKEAYRNPVLRGFHPDPSIVRVGEDYYLVTSSFLMFPGLPIHHSRDLVHWREIGHAVDNLEASGLNGLPGGYGYWAPDISYFDGRFWVVATLRRNTAPFRLQMITWARDPAGPWAPPRFLPIDGIDPSLFTDGDGRRYMLLNPGAMLISLSREGEMMGEPRMISFGTARIKPEGPHLLRKDGWYYLFLAEGGTGEGHMEAVARSRRLEGPYESCPFNPILRTQNPLAPIRRSGHGKPFQLADGRWYMVYLCGRSVEGMTLMGRETALDPMDWTAEGWPMVNRLKGPSCLQPLPLPQGEGEPDGQEAWISPRNDPAAFALVGSDEIQMKAGRDPAEAGPCSLLLARQKEAVFTETAEADLSRAAEGTCAGIVGYYDERSFFLFGLRKEENGCAVILTEQIGEKRNTRIITRQESLTAVIRVEGNGLSRRLSLRREGAEAATIRSAYLCDEGLMGGKRFTGALIGLGAWGGGTVSFRDHQVTFSAPGDPMPV